MYALFVEPNSEDLARRSALLPCNPLSGGLHVGRMEHVFPVLQIDWSTMDGVV